MDIKDIAKLAKVVSDQELTRLEIVDGDFELIIEKGAEVVQAQLPAAPVQYAVAPPAPTSPPAQAAEATVEQDGAGGAAAGWIEITSPIVGTFYRSSSPEADPYVNVGSSVNDESVVCIVEAMKVMNEIHAETTGVIREILVENATPVQFGQPLFLVEPR